jgi:hypothetical protein
VLLQGFDQLPQPRRRHVLPEAVGAKAVAVELELERAGAIQLHAPGQVGAVQHVAVGRVILVVEAKALERARQLHQQTREVGGGALAPA